MSCIFCQIAAKEIPSELLYEDDELIAFRDINPRPAVHILIVPRKHIADLNELSDEDTSIMGKMTIVAKALAQQEGIAEKGYRITTNCGAEGGQVVPHLHMHLLGGQRLSDQLG